MSLSSQQGSCDWLSGTAHLRASPAPRSICIRFSRVAESNTACLGLVAALVFILPTWWTVYLLKRLNETYRSLNAHTSCVNALTFPNGDSWRAGWWWVLVLFWSVTSSFSCHHTSEDSFMRFLPGGCLRAGRDVRWPQSTSSYTQSVIVILQLTNCCQTSILSLIFSVSNPYISAQVLCLCVYGL